MTTAIVQRLIEGIIATLVLILSPCQLLSQNTTASPFLTAQSSVERGVHGGGLSVYSGSPDCGLFGNSLVTSAQLGVGIEVPVPFSDRFRFAGRLGWRWGSERYSYIPSQPLPILDDVTHRFVDVGHEYRIDLPLRALSFDMLAKYQLVRGVSAVGGVTTEFRIASDLKESDVITDDTVRFTGGGRSLSLPPRPDLTIRTIGLGMLVGISVSTPLGERLACSGELYARGGLLSTVRQAGTFGVAGGFVLSVSYDLASPESHEYATDAPPPLESDSTLRANIPRDTLASADTNRITELSASIRAYGIDTDGDVLPAPVLQVFETMYSQYIEPPSTIEFKPRSTRLGDYYMQRDGSSAGSFSFDSIASLGLGQVHARHLDIIGARMSADSSMRLDIVGGTDRNEPGSLASERERSVQSYLKTTWGIDSRRFTTRAQLEIGQRVDGHSPERRGVVIIGDERMVAPLVVHGVERQIVPPTIVLDPVFHATAGVKSWGIRFIYAGRDVAHYSSDSNAPLSRLHWQIDGELSDNQRRSMLVELSVQDSLGQTAVARDSVPLVIVRIARVVERHHEPEREWGVYSLFDSSCDDIEMNKWNLPALRQIVRDAGDGGRVVVLCDREASVPGCSPQTIDRRADVLERTLRDMLRTAGVRHFSVERKYVNTFADYLKPYPERRALRFYVAILVERDPVRSSLPSR